MTVEEKHPELRGLIALGKERGYLLYDEIYEVLPEEVTERPRRARRHLHPASATSASRSSTSPRRRRRRRRRAASPAEASLPDLTTVEKTNDPVRMYLREMGTVKLLDREGEVRIAKRIEQGEAKIYQALANNPIVLEEILKLLENAGTRLAHGQRARQRSREDAEELDDRATQRIEGVLAQLQEDRRARQGHQADEVQGAHDQEGHARPSRASRRRSTSRSPRWRS